MIFFYLMAGIMPLVQHPIWSEIKILGLTLNKWVGVCATVAALLEFSATPRSIPIFRTVQSRLFLLFGFMMMGSFLAFGSNVPLAESPFGNWSSFLLLLFISSLLLTSRRRLRWTLLWTVGGVAFASLHLIREWQAGGMGAGVRPGWITGDPNYFALSGLLCLPLGFLLAQQRPERWERLYCLGCALVTLVALTLTGSRGGLLGLLVSGVLLVWHSRRRLQHLAVGGVLLAAVLVLSPTSPLTRLLSPDYSDQGSTEIHKALLFAGLRMFGDHVLTGVGAGNFKTMVRKYLDPGFDVDAIAHNTYLEVAAELGILGLVAFVGIFFFTFRTLARVRRQTGRGRDPFLHASARGLEAGLAGAAVALLFLSALHARLLWFVVVLAICLQFLALKRRRVSLPAPPLPSAPPPELAQNPEPGAPPRPGPR
jgi:putative inorganic carbon (HCO3(-)) transporter